LSVACPDAWETTDTVVIPLASVRAIVCALSGPVQLIVTPAGTNGHVASDSPAPPTKLTVETVGGPPSPAHAGAAARQAATRTAASTADRFNTISPLSIESEAADPRQRKRAPPRARGRTPAAPPPPVAPDANTARRFFKGARPGVEFWTVRPGVSLPGLSGLRGGVGGYRRHWRRQARAGRLTCW
jgi:hypothetical protein